MRGVAAFASVLPALLILFLAQTYRNFWNVEVQNTRSVPILLRQADKMKLEMIGVMSGEASEAALGEADSRPAMAPPTSRDARGLEPEYRQEENTSVTSGRGAVGPARFPAKDPIQQPSIHCNHSSLQAINACLAEHDMPKSFPDFIIIGWAKSSTTGLFYHLGDHPEVIKPTKKEPNFFKKCNLDGNCRSSGTREKDYIENILRYSEAEGSGFTRSTFEASVSYSEVSNFVGDRMRKMVPGVKIISSLREPISRMVSYVNHVKRHNLADHPFNCWDDSPFACLKRLLQAHNYSSHLAPWVHSSPIGKIFVIQHEQLATEPGPLLHVLKEFLGINPNLPHRSMHKEPTRSPFDRALVLTKAEYVSLLDLIKPDVDATIAIIEAMGIDGNLWRETWSAIWRKNLDECSEECWIFSNA